MATKKANLQKGDNSIGYMNVNDDGTLTAISVHPSILSKCEPDIPTLDIDGLAFHESYYSTRGNTYDAPTLVAFAKHKNYKTFDLPLVGIDISHMPFSSSTFGQFLYHLKRVNDTNLDYPVILDDEGVICDGWHRVAKAYLEGRPTVKAIRLLEMPDASGKVDSK